MSVHASLEAHGIALRPWLRDATHQMFRWQEFHGLLLTTENVITIIAVINDSPGSGKLGLLMDRFEQAADDADVAIVVVHFWNERLQQWYERRGYLIIESKPLGKFAMRAGPTRMATCPSCGGRGEWETECCNGANGCDCGGRVVPMGTCLVCKGTGEIPEDAPHEQRRANIQHIAGRCFIGRGPTSGYWANR